MRLRNLVAWIGLALASPAALGGTTAWADANEKPHLGVAVEPDDDAPPAAPADDAPADDAPADDERPAEEPQPPADAPASQEQGPQADDPPNAPAGDSEADQASAPAQLPEAAEGTDPAESLPDEPGATAKIEPATVQGVQPGRTTRDELHALWGEPKQTEKIAGGVREIFAINPPDQVRATIVENIVQSLATRLAQPLAIDAVAKHMHIDRFEAVDVLDERGQPLGRAYPERGVLLAFSPSSNPPQVFQVIVEPIDPQTFLARAETRLADRYEDCLADVKQALLLAPKSGRAHGLHAELTLRAGALETAIQAAQKAVELEPKEPEHRLTLAQILAATGDYAQAIRQARGVIEWGKASPLVAARAHYLCGDYLAAAQDHDYSQAIKYHMQAIKLAEPLMAHQKPAVRRAAKRLLVDANLAVAHDIGWGRWQHKPTVVPKWIDRATTFADDLIAREQAPLETRLHVYEQAVAALSGIAQPPAAAKWIEGLTESGKKIIDESSDATYKARVAWHLGVALNDAAEIEKALGHRDQALALGQTALAYLDQGEEVGKQLPAHDYLRGRLSYRLGALFAVDEADHKQAVTWFDRAVPLLESPVPAAAVDCGKHGEMFVSMAVSYWELANRQEALRLTTQGVKLMEQAASEGLLAKAALAIPYSNLSSMYEQLGDAKAAKKFSELAARHEETKSK
jgi:tetratricopeptide (TPR) repeat protein